MRIAVTVVVALAVFAVAAVPTYAFSFDALIGTSTHASLPAEVANRPVDVPVWETRPWHASFYYAARFNFGEWGLELLHDKMYLTNPPAGVRWFSVTNGYNLVLAQRLLGEIAGMEVRAGAGVVVAVPQGNVDGEELNPHVRRYVAGPAVGVSVTKLLGERLLLETKATLANAKLELDQGRFEVPSAAVHVLIGTRFGR